jgi:hypothetical protein
MLLSPKRIAIRRGAFLEVVSANVREAVDLARPPSSSFKVDCAISLATPLHETNAICNDLMLTATSFLQTQSMGRRFIIDFSERCFFLVLLFFSSHRTFLFSLIPHFGFYSERLSYVPAQTIGQTGSFPFFFLWVLSIISWEALHVGHFPWSERRYRQPHGYEVRHPRLVFCLMSFP